MEHATSNANDADGHCRLPRKYTVARAARSGGSAEKQRDPSARGKSGRGRGSKENVTTTYARASVYVLDTQASFKLVHDYNKLL